MLYPTELQAPFFSFIARHSENTLAEYALGPGGRQEPRKGCYDAGMRPIQRLRHDDPEAAVDDDERRRTPKERFAIAERLIRLAFEMRGEDGRVQKHITRVLQRRR